MKASNKKNKEEEKKTRDKSAEQKKNQMTILSRKAVTLGEEMEGNKGDHGRREISLLKGSRHILCSHQNRQS